MEPYQKRKRLLEERYGKLIQVNLFNDEVLKKSRSKHMLNKLLILLTEKG